MKAESISPATKRPKPTPSSRSWNRAQKTRATSSRTIVIATRMGRHRASQGETRSRARARPCSPLLSSMYDGGMPVVCMANSVIAASNEPTSRASKGERNGALGGPRLCERTRAPTCDTAFTRSFANSTRPLDVVSRSTLRIMLEAHGGGEVEHRLEQFNQASQGWIVNMFALLSARRAAVLARRPFAVARRLQPDRKARSLQALFDSGWTPAVADSGPVDSYGASAVGRRKSAVANVIVRPGQGVFTINDRELIDYFVRDTHRDHVIQPFEFTDTLCDFDVTCRVHGGGLSGARVRRAARRVGSLGFRARCSTAALTHSFRASRAACGRQVKRARSASASVALSGSNRTIARC